MATEACTTGACEVHKPHESANAATKLKAATFSLFDWRNSSLSPSAFGERAGRCFRSWSEPCPQPLRSSPDTTKQNLVADPRIGLLVIDLRSRARLRVNGQASFPTDDQIHVSVELAYPNCPQYIQRRNYRPTLEQESSAESRTGTELTHEQREWIARADTLFVASQHPSSGLDASHRGGNPGFIRRLDSARLRIPDYSGNGMFNTLGNFAANPRAGLLILDLENGRTLQLTGHAELRWDVPDPHNETGGAGRYWDFAVDRWIQINRSLPGATEFLDYSPHNPSRN